MITRITFMDFVNCPGKDDYETTRLIEAKDIDEIQVNDNGSVTISKGEDVCVYGSAVVKCIQIKNQTASGGSASSKKSTRTSTKK